jgi:hypothetical protein
MPRKPRTETPEEPARPRPRVRVVERRLQNPFGEPSADIPMKDPSLVPRWFNEAARNGQIWRAMELGWEPVRKDMVADLDRVGAYTLGPGQTIRRGERQQEHLMCMPKTDRDQIQVAKTTENNRRMANPHAMRNDALESYGQINPRVAEKMSVMGGVTTTLERIERTPELE